MCDQMALKTVGTYERFTTEIAHIASNIFMHFPVQRQRRLIFEHFLAFVAFELLQIGVLQAMASQSSQIVEFFVAFGAYFWLSA